MTISPLTQNDDLAQVGAITPEGWNDLTPHFTYNISSPFCMPLKAVVDGRLAGLGNVVYNKDTAWLAQIVVDAAFRNKGIGKAITAALLDSIDRSRYTTVLLDATDMGHAVYHHFGFETISHHVHFAGTPLVSVPRPDAIIPCAEPHFEKVLELDRSATGEDRSNTLLAHIDKALLYREGEHITGAYYPTLGRGPVVAVNAVAGRALMHFRLQELDHAMLPEENEDGIAFLEQSGFKLTRKSRRMLLGPPRPSQPGFIYNTISGALG